MKVPSPVTPSVGIPNSSISYIRGATPDLSPLQRGLGVLTAGVSSAAAEYQQEIDQAERFKAVAAFTDFDTQARLKLDEQAQSSEPGDTNFADRATTSYQNMEDEFVATLPPKLQDEFRARAAQTRSSITESAVKKQREGLNTYYKDEVGRTAETAKINIAAKPEDLESWKARMDELIDSSSWDEAQKFYAKRDMAGVLERVAYSKEVTKAQMEGRTYSRDVKTAVMQASADLGVDPEDLLTVISFETAGSLSPDQQGGAGGRHMGLIQFGPAEQKRYGITPGMTFGEQMTSVVAYLKDRGYKPGMSVYDLYSTINAGSPGKYNARDGHNGGSPGTVEDKVNQQMAAHRAKARLILTGQWVPPDNLDADPRYANVPYEDRVAARREAEATVNEQLVADARLAKERAAVAQNALYNSLAQGTAGQSDIADAMNAGLLDDYDSWKKANDILDRREKDGADLRDFQTKYNEGGIFDPTDEKDKNGMNLYFGQQGLDALNAGNVGYVNSQLIPLFQKTNMLPSDAVAALDALGRSNDGRKMLFAQATLSQLENLNPAAYARQVPETTRNRADRWEALRNVMTEEELINVLRDAPTQEMRNAQDRNRQEAKRALNDPKAETELTFDGFVKTFNEDWFSGIETPGLHYVVAGMRADWEALMTENFAKTGSWEASVAATKKQLDRMWGVTQVGGTRVLTKYPPEKYYPSVAGSYEWMQRQLRGELALGDNEKVQLYADDITQAEIKNGKPASYQVAIQKDGVWTVLQKGGRNERFFFQPTEPDRELHKQNLRVRDAEEQLKEAEKFLPKADFVQLLDPAQFEVEIFKIPTGPQDLTVPAELGKEIEEKKARLLRERETEARIKGKAEGQYSTPAQRRLIELQRQVEQYQNELYNSTETLEDWPKKDEFAKVLDELDQVKKQVDAEVSAKRSGKGVQ